MIRFFQYILIFGMIVIFCGCPYKPAHRFDSVYSNNKFAINPYFVSFEKSAGQLEITTEIKNQSNENLIIDFSETSIISKGDTFIVQNLLGVGNRKLNFHQTLSFSQSLVLGFRFVDIIGFTNDYFELFFAGKDTIYAKFNFRPK
jgi:hypothetical protein